MKELIEAGYRCYISIETDENHRYRSWEHCHRQFLKFYEVRTEDDIDYLSLHLSWYLASWGMLRNSFLMQKDYKIHKPVIRELYSDKWKDLWDISFDKLADIKCSEQIISLAESISEIYVQITGYKPTDTLITKILLGSVACVPAYDRYFKLSMKAKSLPQTFSAKSLQALGELYISHSEEFQKLEKYCSSELIYPSAKILDMCFFEYGFENNR